MTNFLIGKSFQFNYFVIVSGLPSSVILGKRKLYADQF